jgi:hypothetical protein
MMDKPRHRTVTATARPIRVAYLVDLSNCHDELLNAVFAECYSRWGGRRSLIVPATEEEIDPDYDKWLVMFDADVMYSYASLSEGAVQAIHERYAPAVLVKHRTLDARDDERRRYRVDLPISGLPSLSVFAAYRSRRWGFERIPTDVRTFDSYLPEAAAPFTEENFGFLSSSYPNGVYSVRNFPDLYAQVTLISQAMLDDRHVGRESHSQYVTDELALLRTLSEKRFIVPLSNRSEMFSEYLSVDNNHRADGLSVVIGDTPEDRVLFWNFRHYSERLRVGELSDLRIPTSRLDDDNFWTCMGGIIERRAPYESMGNQKVVWVRSCSLSKEELSPYAERLRTSQRSASVRIDDTQGLSQFIPTFRQDRDYGFRTGATFWSQPKGAATSEFEGARFQMPLAQPWHLREAPPPSGLRAGNWIVDLSIQRTTDHCRYVNAVHTWVLPRRLRIEHAFNMERDAEERIGMQRFWVRPNRFGELATTLDVSVRSISVQVPDDFDALRHGLCNRYEWAPFEGYGDAVPHGRKRLRYIALSDKGRYLLGVTQLFDSLEEAFQVLFHSFWREAIHSLGAAPINRNDDLVQRLTRTLTKRLRAPSNGDWVLSTEEQRQTVAREALKIAAGIKGSQRYLSYGALHEKWRDLVEEDNAEHPVEDERRFEEIYGDWRLEQSIQLLCSRDVLFQGREWRCHTCFNRNWVGIDAIGKTMQCEVCGTREPAPVAGDWHFRLNPFFIDAYRQHGSEVALWVLWRLHQQARRSLYYIPSVKLWLDEYPETKHTPDAEVDLIAVVDGEVSMVESTTSDTLTEKEIDQLSIAARRIRPDKMVVGIVGTEARAAALKQRIVDKMPTGIGVLVLRFDATSLEGGPFLPD